MKLSNVFTMKDKFEKMLHAAAIMTDILMQQNIKPIIQWLEHDLKEKSIVKKLRTPLMIQRLSEFLRITAPLDTWRRGTFLVFSPRLGWHQGTFLVFSPQLG